MPQTHSSRSSAASFDVAPPAFTCAGMRVIVAAVRRARRTGHRLTVVRGAPTVDKLFTLTGTADLIELSDDDPPRPRANGRLGLNGGAAC
jgi:hypothetical protein